MEQRNPNSSSHILQMWGIGSQEARNIRNIRKNGIQGNITSIVVQPGIGNKSLAMVAESGFEFNMTYFYINYFIRGIAHDWLSSYSDVKYNINYFPNELKKTVGVPSVLGQFLFILYVNELSYVVSDSIICLYADDTSVYFRLKFVANRRVPLLLCQITFILDFLTILTMMTNLLQK